MRSIARFFFTAILLGLLCGLPVSAVTAQQRLDLGIHFSPQLMPLRAEVRPDFQEGTVGYTEGGDGLDLGFTTGAYLEYALGSRLSLRGGLNLSRRRYRYPVSEYRTDGSLVRSGTNRVVYTAMELPFAVIYHFDYLRNNGRFLLGAGGVPLRFVGGPQLKTIDYLGSSSNAPIEYRTYSLHVFAGYDHYLSDRFVLGIEPFVSYSPSGDVLMLESRTVGVADLEAGVALRIRFDN